MSTSFPLVHRTFRITIDIETTVGSELRDSINDDSKYFRSGQALIQRLLVHPEVLHQLLCSSAIDELEQARKLLEAEYGSGWAFDQQLLQLIITKLEPDEQVYFTEELEEGATEYCFDGFTASVKRYHMTILDEENG
jgi:hypothetical protein